MFAKKLAVQTLYTAWLTCKTTVANRRNSPAAVESGLTFACTSMFSDRIGMSTTLPCRGRLPLSGTLLHARHLVGRKDHKRPAVTAVASPPHKYAKKARQSGDVQSAAPSFSSDFVKLSSSLKAGQAGSQSDSRRNVQAHASNQQSSTSALCGATTHAASRQTLC